VCYDAVHVNTAPCRSRVFFARRKGYQEQTEASALSGLDGRVPHAVGRIGGAHLGPARALPGVPSLSGPQWVDLAGASPGHAHPAPGRGPLDHAAAAVDEGLHHLQGGQSWRLVGVEGRAQGAWAQAHKAAPTFPACTSSTATCPGRRGRPVTAKKINQQVQETLHEADKDGSLVCGRALYDLPHRHRTRCGAVHLLDAGVMRGVGGG
jgi:hypothetical protein